LQVIRRLHLRAADGTTISVAPKTIVVRPALPH
jgi:hypothetical protein